MKSISFVRDARWRIAAMLEVVVCLLMTLVVTTASGQSMSRGTSKEDVVPLAVLIRITKAEDERRWDNDLRHLFADSNVAIRRRAALAAGRIGNEDAIPPLVELLRKDSDESVRAMAAFGLGEVESEKGADSLAQISRDSTAPIEVRARAIEGLGKIAAALPREQETRERELAGIILEAARNQQLVVSKQATLLILTAILRAHPAGGGPVVAGFIRSTDSRIRADAANVLGRLRLKDANTQLPAILKTDKDPVVRANAARILGVTEEKAALGALLESANADVDSRVRVSAIRALASLKDASAAKPLLERGVSLTNSNLRNRPAQTNEILEIASALGRLLAATEHQDALNWLRKIRVAFEYTAPEVEVAFARIWPAAYISEFGESEQAKKELQRKFILNWRSGAGLASGLGEIANAPETIKQRDELKQKAEELLAAMIGYRESGIKINSLLPLHTEYGLPEVLRSYAAYKSKNLPEVLFKHLQESDVIVRATAADLLGELPPSELTTRALTAALPVAFNDQLNDAVLSILDSLARQKTNTANETIKTALDAKDYLVRRRAVNLLKQNGVGDFSSHIGTIKSRNSEADYRRALARIGKTVQLVVTTTKGSFRMELLPSDAPLTVDNFLQLAQRGYFNGITIHRVVANFVVQDGDPRGDGNGGPGYEIRCEINELPFERAVAGMALSGKDTGGSQWFITHSPQPHLDGGYTVFGRIVEGMDVVDSIVRGDMIKSVVIGRKAIRKG